MTSLSIMSVDDVTSAVMSNTSTTQQGEPDIFANVSTCTEADKVAIKLTGFDHYITLGLCLMWVSIPVSDVTQCCLSTTIRRRIGHYSRFVSVG